MNDKRHRNTAIIFLSLIELCVILWIVCAWQIVVTRKGFSEVINESGNLVKSINAVRITLIISLQFLVASYIAMNIVKYRKTLLPYQIMSGAANLYIDFYLSLCLAVFTIRGGRIRVLPTSAIVTNKWVVAFLFIVIVLSIFPYIVFRRTDRRRLITTANEAYEKSHKLQVQNVEVFLTDDEKNDTAEEKLLRIKRLLDSGLITQEEYDNKRAEILNSI